jgi:hypothetical protein
LGVDSQPGPTADDPPLSALSLCPVEDMSKRGFSVVPITVVLDVLALVAPVLPQLVLHFLRGQTSEAALVYGLFGTAWALMQFVFLPIQGALSDRYGRRPVIVLSDLGTSLDYILMALAPAPWVLMVGRVLNGITSASISTASAYIADTMPPDRRSAGLGMIGVAFGVGFVIGPAMSGLLGGIEPHLPFWVASAARMKSQGEGESSRLRRPGHNQEARVRDHVVKRRGLRFPTSLQVRRRRGRATDLPRCSDPE